MVLYIMAYVFTQDLPKPPIRTPSTFKLINEKIIILACKRQQNSH